MKVGFAGTFVRPLGGGHELFSCDSCNNVNMPGILISTTYQIYASTDKGDT